MPVSWLDYLAPYCGPIAEYSDFNSNGLLCPASQLLPHNYGMNGNGTDAWQTNNLGLDDTAESEVSLPSDMIAIGDHFAFYFGLGPLVVCPVHAGGANVVFCDGHVEYARIREWTKADDIHRARWNNDHQPHPETWPENQDGFSPDYWWNLTP